MNTIYDMGIPHPVAPYPKMIVNAAITGMVPTKEDTPHIPISVPEIVADAIACYNAGASIVHLHARDNAGEPAYQKGLYAEMITEIRAKCPDVIICATTSGRVHNTFEKRSEVLELEGHLKPDMGSLTMGSMNFPNQASVNQPDMIQNLAQKMKDRGIVPEIEVFESGMIHAATVLMGRGILVPPFYFNILLGSIYSAPATLSELSHMVMNLPAGVHWAATGIGRFQLKINLAAVLMGGHVRVGLEDNIYYDQNRTQLATNPMLIERVVRLAREVGREVATAAEAREILGLGDPPRSKQQTLPS